MTRTLWEGAGEWAVVLDAPLLPPSGERCEASVVVNWYDLDACGAPAIAWRLDSDSDGLPWPACGAHS